MRKAPGITEDVRQEVEATAYAGVRQARGWALAYLWRVCVRVAASRRGLPRCRGALSFLWFMVIPSRSSIRPIRPLSPDCFAIVCRGQWVAEPPPLGRDLADLRMVRHRLAAHGLRIDAHQPAGAALRDVELRHCRQRRFPPLAGASSAVSQQVLQHGLVELRFGKQAPSAARSPAPASSAAGHRTRPCPRTSPSTCRTSQN